VPGGYPRRPQYEAELTIEVLHVLIATKHESVLAKTQCLDHHSVVEGF
jgi:hypothetical protein